jgi:hypothetical protein
MWALPKELQWEHLLAHMKDNKWEMVWVMSWELLIRQLDWRLVQ